MSATGSVDVRAEEQSRNEQDALFPLPFTPVFEYYYAGRTTAPITPRFSRSNCDSPDVSTRLHSGWPCAPRKLGIRC